MRWGRATILRIPSILLNRPWQRFSWTLLAVVVAFTSRLLGFSSRMVYLFRDWHCWMTPQIPELTWCRHQRSKLPENTVIPPAGYHRQSVRSVFRATIYLLGIGECRVSFYVGDVPVRKSVRWGRRMRFYQNIWQNLAESQPCW